MSDCMKWRMLLAQTTMLFLVSSSTSYGQSGSALPRGLDLVILVDVSASMYRKPTLHQPTLSKSEERPADGSDPERIRWDAVRLAADLLTADDRLLVVRFNDFCPAEARNEKRIEKANVYFDKEKKVRLRPEDDFLCEFASLANQRNDLNARIARFNTTEDWRGGLDSGGTRMVHALQTVAGYIRRVEPGRQMHMVLLTDGDDNDRRNNGMYREGTNDLEKALKFYRGENGVTIPIHTVMLHNETSSNVEVPDGELFLRRISEHTSGGDYTVKRNRDLISLFLKLVRDVKGIWYDERTFVPSQTGEIQEIAKRSVKGIVDLGVLDVEEMGPNVVSPRCIQPPKEPISVNWNGLQGEKEPVRTRRDPSKRPIYDYRYYGAEGGSGQSPFAKLPDSARVSFTIRVGELRRTLIITANPQRPVFTWISPKTDETFYRYQTLKVTLGMSKSQIFAPEDFELTASLARVGEDVTSDSVEVLQCSTLQPTPGKQRELSGDLPLGALPRTGQQFDYYTLALSAKAKGNVDHGLAGLRRNLPLRIFVVDNKLEFGAVKPVELTESSPTATIELTTTHPTHEDLRLNAKFIPFSRKGIPLRLNKFDFKSSDGPIVEKGLPLREGKGSIQMGFPVGAELPQGGVDYEPGKIVVTGGKDALGKDLLMEPVEIPVRLRLGLSEIGINPSELSVVANLNATPSPVAKVFLTSAGQAKTKVGDLTLAMQKAVRSTSQQNTIQEAFPPDQLWIQRAGPANDERSQRLTLQIGDEFQVYFIPKEQVMPGSFPYTISVSGDGVYPLRVPLKLSIDPPVLEVSKEVTVYTHPGSVGEAWIDFHVKNLVGHDTELFVQGGTKDCMFTSENSANPTESRRLELATEHPTDTKPLKVSDPKNDEVEGSFPFRIQVPEGTPFGRYCCQVEIGGPHVAQQVTTVHLVVNELLVESMSYADSEQGVWVPAEDVLMFQFFRCQREKTIRVRCGLADTLSADVVTVTARGPLANELGDTSTLPSAQTSFDSDHQALIVTLKFPCETNADPLPYEFLLMFEASKLHAKPRELPVRVRFYSHFDVIESRPSS